MTIPPIKREGNPRAFARVLHRAPEMMLDWKAAETAAAEWLIARGARILARNYRWRGGEIDIVAEWSGLLVFVEVRARHPGAWTDGLGSVVFSKRRRLASTASLFMSRYSGSAEGVRFDVLAWDGLNWRHFPDAFDFS